VSQVRRQATKSNGAGQPELLRQLDLAPPHSRPRLVLSHVRDQAIRILALPASRRIDSRQPLSELGLDSLMAVELRNVLAASIGRALPATLLFDYPKIEALAGYLTRELLGDGAESGPMTSLTTATVSTHLTPGSEASTLGVVEAVQHLADEEVDRLFAERLAGKAEA
jgi:acyl carrier protein